MKIMNIVNQYLKENKISKFKNFDIVKILTITGETIEGSILTKYPKTTVTNVELDLTKGLGGKKKSKRFISADHIKNIEHSK